MELKVFCLLIQLILLSPEFALANIDPDTKVKTVRRRKDGSNLKLVFSDEFNVEGRSFEPGKDPHFEAVEKPDDTNQAIQFYNSSTDYVTTRNGSLVIVTRAVKTTWTHWDEDFTKEYTFTKNYTSGMIQSWNKFCFTGGVLEMSIRLPGKADSGGLWPAAWMMGNLARATFSSTTMYMWPWSYNKCGEIDHLDTKQQINACDQYPGYGMHPGQGRGAPEIDIFEVMPGHNMPGFEDPIKAFMSTSLQISPGVPQDKCRPKNGEQLNTSRDIWYENLRVGKNGTFNYGFWGQECGPEYDTTEEKIHKYMQDAISVNTDLEDTHFDRHHVYRIEWQPGPNGFLDWWVDDQFLLGIDAKSLNDLTGAIIPEEPMYLVLNTAISHRWGMPEPCDVKNCPCCWVCYDCTNPECQCTLPDGMKNCKNLPAEMQIDYIRVYQNPKDPTHSLSCSPESHPTAGFIDAFRDHYEICSSYLFGRTSFCINRRHNWAPTEGKGFYLRGYIVVILGVLFLMSLAIYVGRQWNKVSRGIDPHTLTPQVNWHQISGLTYSYQEARVIDDDEEARGKNARRIQSDGHLAGKIELPVTPLSSASAATTTSSR